jgi:hypothetical protein
MVVIVVALAVWTISVAMAPHKVPRSGVAAALLSTVRNAEPAIGLSPWVMTVVPSRNRPSPPRMEMAVDPELVFELNGSASTVCSASE